jgi:hypothetical protein
MATFSNAYERHSGEGAPSLTEQYRMQPVSWAAALTYLKVTFTDAYERHSGTGHPSLTEQYRMQPVSWAASLTYLKVTYEAAAGYLQRYSLNPQAPAGSGNRIPWKG